MSTIEYKLGIEPFGNTLHVHRCASVWVLTFSNKIKKERKKTKSGYVLKINRDERGKHLEISWFSVHCKNEYEQTNKRTIFRYLCLLYHSISGQIYCAHLWVLWNGWWNVLNGKLNNLVYLFSFTSLFLALNSTMYSYGQHFLPL